MARAGVNYADISKAAEYIQHEGHLPTVDRVRAYLGTGSKSTIAPLLKQWREQNITNTNALGLPQDVLNAVKSLCEMVQHQADNKIETIQNTCNSITEELQGQLTAVLAELSALKKVHTTTERALVDAQTDHQSLTKKFDSAQHKHEKTAFQLAETVSRVAELKAVNTEFKQECKDIRGHFEHYQQHIASDRQREQDLFHTTQLRDQAQLDAFTHQIRGLTSQLSDEIKAREQYEDKVHGLSSEVQTKDHQITQVNAVLTALQSRFDEVNKKNAALAKNNDSQQKELKDALRHQVETNQTLALLKQSHKGISAELDNIKINHHNLQNEYQLPLQEKTLLQGQYKQLAMSLP
jgi:chromosome segregation ATPase